MPGIREAVVGLLSQKDYSSTLDLARSDRRAVRALMGLLFHEEALIRWRAVTMFGHLAAKDPELVRPQLFRLYYSLSEESSVVGWGSAQAIGEIARVNPELAKEVIRPVVHFMDDEELSQPSTRNTVQLAGTIWAIGNIADTLPKLAAEMGPSLVGFLEDPDDGIRGLAAWALCRMGYAPASDKLKKMLDDRAVVEIYSHDELYPVSVGTLAGNALQKINGTGTGCL